MEMSSSGLIKDKATVEKRIVSLVREFRLPTDVESVKFTGMFRIESSLYKVAERAAELRLAKVWEFIDSLLWRWTLEAGAHQSGWSNLEYGFRALIMLAINSPYSTVEKLIERITLKREINSLPEQSHLDQAARELRSLSGSGLLDYYSHDYLDYAIMNSDHKVLSEALIKVATTISPATEKEPIRRHI